MNVQLKIITSISYGQTVTVDLSIVNHTKESVIYRNIINKVGTRRFELSPVYTFINNHNLEDIITALKDRDRAIDEDIIKVIGHNIIQVMDIYDNFCTEEIRIKRTIKLKKI